MRKHTFYLPDHLGSDALLDGLSEAFGLVCGRAVSARETVLDTFDWRLYRAGSILVGRADGFSLTALAPSSADVTGGTPLAQPKFWQDFDDGPLQDALRDRLGIRALMPLVKIRRRSRAVRILNRDEKTVVRLVLDEVDRIQGREMHPVGRAVKLIRLRGYDAEATQVADRLRSAGLAPAAEDLAIRALRDADLVPGGYSSKLKIALDPGTPARDAALSILKHLAEVIRVNEPGIVADTDSEFLHDYRVSVRRTRSALAQIKGVLPAVRVRVFGQRFREIARLTNRTRDLDVYLLKRDEYRSMVPADLAAGLDPVFEKIRQEHGREHRKLRRKLRGKGYANQMDEWLAFLESPGGDADDTPAARVPIGACAGRWIRRRHRKILKRGRRLTEKSPDADFHELRIDCKKLRYLMEFFASLYPPQEIEALVAQLKRLQDNLGDHNDLAVQGEDLRVHLAGLQGTDRPDLASAAAIGGLIATLARRQRRLRKDFQAAFDAFSGKENTRLFGKLFGAPERGKH